MSGNEQEKIVPMLLSQETLAKMSKDEQHQVKIRIDRFDENLRHLQVEYPVKLLLQVPIAVDNSAEIRVSRWPKSVAEFDVLLNAVKATRSAFLKSRAQR